MRTTWVPLYILIILLACFDQRDRFCWRSERFDLVLARFRPSVCLRESRRSDTLLENLDILISGRFLSSRTFFSSSTTRSLPRVRFTSSRRLLPPPKSTQTCFDWLFSSPHHQLLEHSVIYLPTPTNRPFHLTLLTPTAPSTGRSRFSSFTTLVTYTATIQHKDSCSTKSPKR